MEKGILLPSFYLPPTSFFTQIKQNRDSVWIERYEHFPKQTYRNRCVIATANGALNLSIPIQKGLKEHTKMKDVKISYDADWQRLHWMSLQTAYRSSPYFEYYEEIFAPFYHKKEVFLFDFNQKLLEETLQLLKMPVQFFYTEAYQSMPEALQDFRAQIHPKRPPLTKSRPYYQVFDDKFGFMPNLSIIDLLCSQGPGAGTYI